MVLIHLPEHPAQLANLLRREQFLHLVGTQKVMVFIFKPGHDSLSYHQVSITHPKNP